MSASADRVHASCEEIDIRRIYYKRITTDMINRIYIFNIFGDSGLGYRDPYSRVPVCCAIAIIAHNHSLTQRCAIIKCYSCNHRNRHMLLTRHSRVYGVWPHYEILKINERLRAKKEGCAMHPSSLNTYGFLGNMLYHQFDFRQVLGRNKSIIGRISSLPASISKVRMILLKSE